MIASPRTEVATRRSVLRSGPVARYERMLELRMVEDRILELFREGDVPGSTHTAQGQEAISVALATVTSPTDPVTCTYRGHTMALALGLAPEQVIGEVMGRSIGALGGVGGSMHLASREFGLLPTFAIVGAGLPVAVGAAVAARQAVPDAMGVAVCGDGATNIGAFHESLNLAAAWQVPVLFVIENNLYGEFSPIERTTPITDLHVRGTSYAMPSMAVDGQDCEQLLGVMQEQSDAVRSDGRPRLLEVKTYRYAGHSRTDTGAYRKDGELERWMRRDPVQIAAAQLAATGTSSDELDVVHKRVTAAVDAATETVRASQPPELAAMFRNVWNAEARP